MTHNDAVSREIDGVFAAIDRQDTTAFVGFLTDNAVFVFGSAPPARGRAAIVAAVDGFFRSIAGLTHQIGKSVMNGSTRFIEGEVTYTRLDGSQITLPFVDVFEYEGELIASYKIYMDIGLLYAD